MPWPASPVEPEPLRVFERRLGPARGGALLGLGLLGVGAIAASLAYQRQLEDLVLALGAPFGLGSTWLPRVALAFAPLVALAVLMARAHRRCGRCVVDEDLLVFEPGLWPAWMSRTVIAPDQVLERAPVAGGVVVRAREVSGAAPRLFVPTDGADDLELALAHLDRRPEPAALRAGRADAPRWFVNLAALLVLLVVSATALVPALLWWRFGGWELAGAVGVLLVALATSPCLAALSPWARRVFVGRGRLAVGEELFGYDELTAVGLGDGFLACAAGRRTCLAWVGEGEAAVRESLAARLAERGRAVDEVLGPLPAAAARARRRVRTALLAAPPFVAPALLVWLSAVAPNHELEALDDDVHGQRLFAVRERDRLDAPSALLLVGGAPGQVGPSVAIRPAGWWAWTLGRADADLLVDLERGELRDAGGDGVVARFARRATFVHVTPDRQVHAGLPDWSSQRLLEWRRRLLLIGTLRAGRAGRRGPWATGVEVDVEASVPSTLERLDLTHVDPALERAALGWTTRRCFKTGRGADELVWGVDAGRVTFVVRTDRGAGWRVVRDGMGFDAPAFDQHFTGCVVEDGPLALCMTRDGLVADPTLPTDHATLLVVRRRVQAGATLAEALAVRAPGNR